MGHSVRRAVVHRGLAALLGTFVGLLSIEAGLRIAGVDPARVGYKFGLVSGDARQRYLCYSSNPHGEFTPAPDVTGGSWQLWQFLGESLQLEEIRKTPWCVAMHRSSQGLRDREYASSPPDGVTRIVGIGDSFAVGEGVPLERTLFKQVERRLGAGVEIVNAGRSGVDMAAYAAAAPRLCRGLQARHAVVVVILNDIRMPRSLTERRESITGLLNKRNLENAPRWHPRVLTGVRSFVLRRKTTRATFDWYVDAWNPRFNAEGLATFRGSLETLRGNGSCDVALVIYPLMEGLGGDYPFAAVHRTIADMAGEVGLPLLDLLPAFRGRAARDLQVHPTDHHPNGRAHAIAAEAVATWIDRDLGWLPASR